VNVLLNGAATVQDLEKQVVVDLCNAPLPVREVAPLFMNQAVGHRLVADQHLTTIH
jgi:hypothetical protein